MHGVWKKTDPFIYLIVRNVDLLIYCPLIFYTHLLLVVRQIEQSIHWKPREQAASKNLWAKNIRIYRNIRRVGPFTYESRNIGSVIYFLLKKRGMIIYLAAQIKGAIRYAHPYCAIYRRDPPPPTHPPPHTHTHPPEIWRALNYAI